MSLQAVQEPSLLPCHVYARISKDSDGAGLGVARQEEQCRAMAAVKGWEVSEVLTENDVSASAAKKRPQFERLIAGMKSGEVKAVVAYRVDRLVRRLDDLARLMDTAKKHGVLVATCSGDLDLTTAQGRAAATLFGALASIEVDATSERVKARNDQARRAGRLTNGGSRPFGWKLDRVTHEPAEAAVIRDVAGKVVAGATLTGVCGDLNRAGVPTGGGRRWDVSTLRKALMNQRHAGRLEHAGKVVMGPDGEPVRAVWEPILDPDVFDELQVAIASRRRISDRWAGERRHLLTGALSRCGVCGQQLVPFQQTSGVGTYRCRGHLSRNRDRTDAYVLEQAREYALAHPIRVQSWSMAEKVDLTARITTLEQRLADLEDQFVSEGGDAARLGRMTAALDGELEALRAERLNRLTIETGTQWAQFDMGEMFARSASLLPHATSEQSTLKAAAIEEQRHHLRIFVQKVVIHPTEKRGPGFDSDSIEIVWRDPNSIKWTAEIEK